MPSNREVASLSPEISEARQILRLVPREHDESKQGWLLRAARFFGLTPAQAKKIEYGEVKDMRASRLDAMRAIRSELLMRAARRQEILDAITEKLAALGSDPGGGGADSDCERTAPAGRRGDRDRKGSVRAGKHAAAAGRAQR